MANWCFGTLTLRGSAENVRKFLLNGLEGIKEAETITEENEQGLKITCDYPLWIKGCERSFIEELDVVLPLTEQGVEKTMVAKAAWEFSGDELQRVAQEYEIDMFLGAIEIGMCVKQTISIVDGGMSEETVPFYSFAEDELEDLESEKNDVREEVEAIEAKLAEDGIAEVERAALNKELKEKTDELERIELAILEKEEMVKTAS